MLIWFIKHFLSANQKELNNRKISDFKRMLDWMSDQMSDQIEIFCWGKRFQKCQKAFVSETGSYGSAGDASAIAHLKWQKLQRPFWSVLPPAMFGGNDSGLNITCQLGLDFAQSAWQTKSHINKQAYNHHHQSCWHFTSFTITITNYNNATL